MLFLSKKVFSATIYFWEAFLLSTPLVCLAIFLSLWLKGTLQSDTSTPWSIGIYRCSSIEPFDFTEEGINNPVLTAIDITDTKASFVADPFLIVEGGNYYMFFEVFNSRTRQGDIGLAVSTDGIIWNYKQIIMDEPFHLAYPCVFKWGKEYYMLIAGRYYRALNFPIEWNLAKILNIGKAVKDATIFSYQNKWFLFSATEKRDGLQLHYAEMPLGPWLEHPKSPVVFGDANKAAPAGPVILFDNRIVRYAQDVTPYYGNQVWAFEITGLTPENYQERQIGRKPILKGCDNWNTRGMHQISPVRIKVNQWIAAVDGY
jgi:hypothetical protein